MVNEAPKQSVVSPNVTSQLLSSNKYMELYGIEKNTLPYLCQGGIEIFVPLDQ